MDYRNPKYVENQKIYEKQREEVYSFARSYRVYNLSSSICAVIFITLVLSDVWKAYRRKAIWIPGRALVLSALTIQLLLFIDHLDVSVNSSNQHLKDMQLILLVEGQLLIDSRRVMMCVFIAYLLPGIVSQGLRSVWGDVGALALIVIAHMAYEAYFLLTYDIWGVSARSHYKEYWTTNDLRGHVEWLIPSYIAVSLAMILLVVLLSCAVIAGKSIRNTMSQKVPPTLSSCCDSGENRLCNNIKDHVLRSWIVVRASQPDYIMARSVFGAFAGVVVTLCDVLLIVKGVFFYPVDPVDITVFATQLAFVVVGSIVVVFRWLSAVFYFPKDLGYLLRCEEFWTREIVQQKRDLRRCRLILSLLLTMLQCAQKLVVFLSKLCWFISQFAFRKIRPSTMKENNMSNQFSKYKEALETIRMPGENAYSLWRANKSAFDKTDHNFEKGIKNGKSSFKKLISLIHQTREIRDGEAPTSLKEEELFKAVGKNSLTDLKEEKHFKTVGKISWKMRAVSLIHLIIYLCDGTDSDEVNDCIEAYRQAFPFMEMVDRSDPEAKLVSEAANNEFTTLENIWQKHPKMRSAENFRRAQRDEEKALNRPQSQREEAIGTEDQWKASNELLKQKIRTPLEDNIKKLYQEEESKGENCDKYPSVDEDSEDLKTVAARISLYKIWNVVVLDSNPDDAIQTSRSNPDDAFQKLRSNPGDAIYKLRCLLAHIINHCIKDNVLDEAIRKNCNKWAEDGEENEIFNAASIAGKAQGVREQIN